MAQFCIWKIPQAIAKNNIKIFETNVPIFY